MSHRKTDEIIERCLENDRSAQGQLYEMCFDGLMKVCIRYFNQREDAVEVLNQSFLKILLSLKDYQRDRSFTNWINSITLRTCIDEYRKKKRYRDMVDQVENYETLEPEFKPVYNEVIESLSQEEVDQILKVLSDEECLVFNLYEFEGYSHQEIAQQLEVSERSSKRYLQRAKLKLRDELERKADIQTKV
jgi:RNA polymerase sigma factor (sigma-70 family)